MMKAMLWNFLLTKEWEEIVLGVRVANLILVIVVCIEFLLFGRHCAKAL